MNEAVLGLALAYVAVSVLLVALVIFGAWPLWIRAGCVVLVTGLFFVNYVSLSAMMGWPARDLLPERFLLLASSIKEPDKTAGEAGLIHVWVTSLAGDRPADAPRAYELPYTTELHGQLEDALKNQRNGVLQIGSSKPMDDRGRELPRDSSRMALPDQEIHIGDLPDPRLPEK